MSRTFWKIESRLFANVKKTYRIDYTLATYFQTFYWPVQIVEKTYKIDYAFAPDF